MVTSSIPIEIVFDRCLQAIRERGYSIEDCLAHYPEHREELEPLLILSLRLQSARTLEAPPEFRATASLRMDEYINNIPRPSKKRARSMLASLINHSNGKPVAGKLHSFFMFGVIIAILLFLMLAGGVVYAASNALPGQIFYPLKESVELARLAISSNPLGDAWLYVDFSQQRMTETDVLLRNQQFGEAKYSLIEYQVDALYILDYLNNDQTLSSSRYEEFVRSLHEQFSQNETYLRGIMNQIPDPLRPSAERALELTTRILAQAK